MTANLPFNVPYTEFPSSICECGEYFKWHLAIVETEMTGIVWAACAHCGARLNKHRVHFAPSLQQEIALDQKRSERFRWRYH